MRADYFSDAPASAVDPDIRARLTTALDAVRAAGDEAMRGFGAGLAIETKADGSPVTAADRAAEQALRETIRAVHPDDGILGEELGEISGSGEWRWIVDPIDGTAAFVAGVPLFGVLAAVERRGEPVVGVLHFPALGQTVWASAGAGAWSDGARVRVSTTTCIEDARVLTSELAASGYERLPGNGGVDARDARHAWQRLARRARLARTWGDAYGYALVATGRADVMIDPACALWDAAPLIVVIEEAGGVFTDVRGRRTHAGGSAVATNRTLRAEVDRALLGTGEDA